MLLGSSPNLISDFSISTPKVTSGASTITCYTKYSPPARHAGQLHCRYLWSLILITIEIVKPDLIVDGIELFLQHESQRLRVRLTGRRQYINRAVQSLVVGNLNVARVESVLNIGQDVRLLHPLPLLLVQSVYLKNIGNCSLLWHHHHYYDMDMTSLWHHYVWHH